MATYPGYADCNIELHHTLLQRSAYVTFGVKNDASVDADTIAGQVRSAAIATGSFLSIIDTNVALNSVNVRLGLLGEEDEPGANLTPTNGLAPFTIAIPPNTAVLVTKKTIKGGRRNRGRIYIPWACPSTDYGEDGKIITARLTTLTAAMLTFKNELTTRSVPMYILHKTPGGPPIAPTAVTQLIVSATLATQRRRLRP